MTAVILDDELYCAEALYHLIKKYSPHLTHVQMLTDPEAALSVMRQTAPDILFLDVEMPFMTGFDFLHALGPTSASVIFTTAYDQYAIQAFKVNAVDYLLKPIDKDDLLNAIKKVEQKPQPLDQNLLSGIIKSAIEQQNTPKRITIHTLEGIHLLPLDDIIYCKSDGAYSMIYLKEQNPLMVSKNLTEMMDLIRSNRFFRVHKSHLINQDHIVRVNKAEGGDVIMSNDDRVPISRQRRAEFFDWLTH